MEIVGDSEVISQFAQYRREKNLGSNHEALKELLKSATEAAPLKRRLEVANARCLVLEQKLRNYGKVSRQLGNAKSQLRKFKKVLNFVPRSLKKSTKVLKSSSARKERRERTNHLFKSGLESIHGKGEAENGMKIYFDSHQEQLRSVIEKVDGGKFALGIFHEVLEVITKKASLLSVLEMIDLNIGCNVRGFLSVHRLLVFPFLSHLLIFSFPHFLISSFPLPFHFLHMLISHFFFFLFKQPICTPTGPMLTEGRHHLENWGEQIGSKPISLPDERGFWFSPAKVTSFMAQKKELHPVLVSSFDANMILGEASTLGALRFFPVVSSHPKLQSPREVIPYFRAVGGDSQKGCLPLLKEPFSEIKTLNEKYRSW